MSPRIVGHIDLGHMNCLRTAFDGKSVRPHGGKMRPARNEMDIGAPLREPRAEIPADPAGAHDCNPQDTFLPRQRMVRKSRRALRIRSCVKPEP